MKRFIDYKKQQVEEPEEPRFILPLPNFASLVKIYFPKKDCYYSYINDRFENLKIGDSVYVSGKLENVRGIVKDQTYSFKFDPKIMQRVVSLCDTKVFGKVYFNKEFCFTFNEETLNFKKVLSWFRPILEEDNLVTVVNNFGKGFSLKEFLKNEFSESDIAFGVDIFEDGCIKFLSLKGTKGYALIKLGDLYELEFEYKDDMIYNFSCSCFNSFNCEHKYATLLTLDYALKTIEKEFKEEFNKTNYFCFVNKNTFLDMTMQNKESGHLIFE